MEATAEGGEWGVDSPSSVMGTTDSYTNFTIRVPDESLRCRLVRSRRYRAGTPGGVSRQIFRRHLTALHQVLAEINPSPEPPVCRWTNKSVVFGAVYLAAAIASALAYGFATAFAVFVATSIWAAVASLLFPADHARAQAVSVDEPPTTRLEADRYFMGGRRRVPCRKTRRRHGRRRGNRGYLKKVSAYHAEPSSGRPGLWSVRGGADPPEVCIPLFLLLFHLV